MTKTEQIEKRIKSYIGKNTDDTFHNHWKIFFNDDDRLYGTVTSTGFKIWKYDRIVKGIMHPVITADLKETDRLYVYLKSKMNIAGLLISVIILSGWGIGGVFLIKGDTSFAAFLKSRIPIWFLYFSIMFIAIAYPYSIARKEIIAIAEAIIKGETKMQD